MINPWPLHPQPHDGESMTSWLCRIADANVTTPSSLLSSCLWEERWDRKDLDLIGEKEILLLSSLGQVREGSIRLSKMVLTAWNDMISESKADHKGWIASQRLIRYCPACLCRDKIPYLRILWRLHFFPICPEHKVVLQSGCWKCGKLSQPINKFNSGVCVACNSLFCNAPVVQPKNCTNTMLFISQIQRILDGEPPTELGWTGSSRDYFLVLLFLIRYFYQYLPKEKSWENLFTTHGLPLSHPFDWRKNSYVSCMLMEKSLNTIKKWPANMKEFVGKDQSKFNKFYDKYSTHIPDIIKPLMKHCSQSVIRTVSTRQNSSTSGSTSSEKKEVESAVRHLLQRDVCPYFKTVSKLTGIHRAKLKKNTALHDTILAGIETYHRKQKQDVLNAIRVLESRDIAVTINAVATYLERSSSYIKKSYSHLLNSG